MVRQEDRLGPLQVGIARQDRLAVTLGQEEQGALNVADGRIEPVDVSQRPEPQIRGDLVVPAAGRVKPPTGRTDRCRQLVLDVHVNVLELHLPLEAVGLDGGANLRESGLDGQKIVDGEDALRREHPGVGQRPIDVLEGEAAIEVHRGVEPLHQCVRRLGEAPAPHRGTGAQNCIPTDIWRVCATPGSRTT